MRGLVAAFFLVFAALPAHATYSQSQAADLVIGQPNFTATQANNSSANGASMNSPYAVFVVTNSVSGSSYTFVADTNNNRVLIFKSSAPAVGAIADYVLGQADAFHSNANYDGVTGYSMDRPGCVYSNGVKLFVCDTFNNRVLIWNTIPSTNSVVADVVVGQANFTANGGGATATTYSRPHSVIVEANKMYVADTNNNRVLVYNTVPTANNAAADSVLGQTLMSGCQGQGMHSNCSSTSNPGWNLYNNMHNSATDDTLYNPASVFIDTRTNITYVADLNNNRVLVYLSSAPVGLRSADYVLGQPDMNANECNYGGSASAQTLCNPRSVWADGTHLVVADEGNARVLIWNLPITANTQAANTVVGQANMNANAARNTVDGLNAPMDAYYDAGANQFFVADWNQHRVFVYNGFPGSNGVSASFVLGQNTPTQFNGCNRGSGTPDATMLCNPNSVAGDTAGNLYVGDNYNYRVLVYALPITANTQAAAFVLGQPDMNTKSQMSGGGLTSFNMGAANHISASTSTLALTDPFNHRILIFSLPITTNTVMANYVLGQSTFNTSGANNGGLSGSTLDGWWDWPGFGVQVTTGGIVVADTRNNRVLYYNYPLSNGKAASQVLGQPAFNYNETMKRAETSRSLAMPESLSAANGMLYVADKRNSRIMVYDLPIPPLATIQAQRRPVQAHYVLGQSSFTFPYESIAPGGGSGNWNGISNQTMDRAHGLFAVSSPFALYVNDQRNSRVLIWNNPITANNQGADLVLGQSVMSSAQCNQNSTPNSGTLCWTSGAPWADANGLFVADGGRWRAGVNNNRVLYWSPLPTSNGQAATGVLGQPDFVSNSVTPGASPFGLSTSQRGGLTTDGSRLAVTDSINHRVLIFDPIPDVSAAGASIVLGQTNMSGNTANNGGVSAASMNRPQGIFWDGRQFFVADTQNGRVLVWNGWPKSSGQPADFVVGQSNFSGSACFGPGVTTGLCRPHSVYSDGKTLWVQDQHETKAWALPIAASGASPSFELGQSALTSNPVANWNGISANSEFRAHGVMGDGERLYIGDRRNHRFLIFSPIPTSNAATASLVAGQPGFTTNNCNSNPGGQALCGADSSITDGRRLYMSDIFNNVVRFWNTPLNALQQVQDGNLGGGAGASALNRPISPILIGNKLWILDSNNNRVLRFTSPATNLFNVAITSAMLPSTIQQGQPYAGFRLVVNAPNAGFPATWTSLKVYNNGSLPDSSLQVRLYKDFNNDGVFQSGSDLAVGSFITFNNGKATLNFSQPLDTNFATFFVTVQVNPQNLPFGPTGFPSASIRIFHNFNSFGFSNSAVEFGGNVPVGLAYNSGFATPVDDADFAQMTATSAVIAGVPLLNNATGVVMAALQMQTTNDWAFMNTLVVNKAGSAQDTDIAGMSLWLDGNANGQLEPGIDTNLMSSSLTFGGGQAFLSPTTQLPISTTPVNLLLVADFAGSADNAGFGISVDASSILLQGADKASSVQTTLPFTSPLVTLRPAIGYATATVPTSQWWNSTFTFVTNTGQQGVSYFRAVFDGSASHVWTNTETKWTTPIATFTAPGTGQSWYVHLKAFNAGNNGGNTIDLGPFWYESATPTGSAYRHNSSTQGLLGETQFGDLVTGVTVQLTVQDTASGLNLTLPGQDATLVGWWRFATGTGTYVHDFSGHAANGAATSPNLWTRGVVGNGLAFGNVAAQYAAVPAPANATFNNAGFTMAGWAYMADPGTTDILWGGADIDLRAISNGSLFQFSAVQIGSGCNPLTAQALPLHTWQHVAFVVDNNFNRNRVYVNGVEAVSCAGTTIEPSQGYRFGQSWTGGSPMRGMLDDFKLYNRSLSPAEMAALAASRADAFWIQYSTDTGASWTVVQTTTTGLAPYVALTGATGSLSPETLKAYNLSFVQSANPSVCAGNPACSATNQVRFFAGDVAGNTLVAGPFSVLVDTVTPQASLANLSPANARYLNGQPNFSWTTPPTAVINGMGPGSSYLLQVANNDPAFAPGNVVVSVATPAVSGVSVATYISTYTLASGTTYYWRVQAINGLLGTRGPWSPTFSFVGDFTPPTAGNYQRWASTGGVPGFLGESQWETLLAGVTAQITVQDTLAGLSRTGGAAPSAGSVALVRFDEGVGGAASDSTGNGHSVTVTGTPNWVAGHFGNGINLLSGNNASFASSVPMGSNWTIETWIRTPLAPTGRWNALVTGTQEHVIVDTNILGVWNGGFFSSGFNMTSLAPGFHHFAAVGSGGITKFYVDGSFVGQSNAQRTENVTTLSPSSEPWGVVDDLRFLGSALSPSQIAQDALGSSGFVVTYSTNAGSSWNVVSSTFPTDTPYVAMTGVEGSLTPETLSVYRLPLAKSTNTFVCLGIGPCGATNQVQFTVTDRGGNATTFGPIALLVDTPVDTALPSLVSPPNQGYTGLAAPTFSWLHPGATVYPGLSAFYLEVSSQPAFTPLTISISSPIVPGQASSQYVSTTTLSAGTTYYWRVRVLSYGGVFSPFSPAFSFQTDFAPPTASNYLHFGSTGGAFVDFQFNDLQSGIVAQATVQDALTGLNLDGAPDAATLALYQFESGVGNKITNTARPTAPAYLRSGAAWGAGRWGRGASLTGGSAFVQIDSATAGGLNTYSGAMTVQLWVKPNATLSADTVLIHKGNGSFGWKIGYLSGQLVFALQNGTGISCGSNAVCVNAPIGGGQWNLVTATYDGVSMNLYLNGQVVGNVTNTGGYGINGDSIYVGANGGASQYLTGTVDDVRLFAYPRSPAQIAADSSGASPALAMFSNDAGRTWTVTGATYPVTGGAPYIAMSGATGSQTPQTFELRNISVIQSTSSLTGAGATNQVKFMLTDVAGNFLAAGPFAILFDSASLTAIATPTVPLNGAFSIASKPTFRWLTSPLASVVQYNLQVDDDPGFSTLDVNITTPAVFGEAVATYTATVGLAEGTTFYWRVQARTNLNRNGPWSQVSSFVTDYSGPSTSAFATIGSTGGLFAFNQFNDLAAGVTAQLSVRDLVSGLDGAPEQLGSLVGRWRFEEGAGLSALDFTGQRDGTLTASTIWGTGQVGGGLAISGGNYVAIPTVSTTWTGLTVAAWIKPVTAAAFQTAWSSVQYQFLADGTGGGSTARFWPRVTAGGGCAPQTAFAYALNQWWHVAFVVDPGANQNRIYVNGQLAASCTGAGTPANTAFRFGSDGLSGIGGTDGMTGGLDEFVISQRALTDPEIQAEADALSFYSYNVRYSTNAGASWRTVRSTATSSQPYIALSGSFASTAQETMKVVGLQLAQSTRTTTCSGAGVCSATNQVIFAITDRAGNSRTAGPFSVLVDTTALVAISTPSYPASGAYVNKKTPTFTWLAPSTITLSGLTSFGLEAAGDPAFATLAVNISTPGVAQLAGAYVSTYTLTEGTTYYWRVRARDALGNWSPYSQTASFVVDVTSPAISSFGSVNSTGTLIGESLPNDMSAGATVQLSVQDAGSGVVAGSGFSVQYSTTAGATWVDSIATLDALTGTGETDARSFASFGGRLYLGTGPGAKLYSTTDGAGWSLMTQFGGETRVTSLASHGGKLYAGTQGAAKVWSSANGTIWGQVFAAPSATDVTALASFNGRVYAGVTPGATVYASADGSVWNRAFNDPSQASISSMLFDDGRLYAVTAPDPRVWMTFDGASWMLISAPFTGQSWKLAAFNGKLYAASSGAAARVYASSDGGATWTQVFTDPTETDARSIAVFGGKLYVGTAPNGRLYVSPDGASWTLSGRASAETDVNALASFADQLLAATGPNAKAVRLLTVPATQTGVDGSMSLETLKGVADLTQSTNTTVCNGVGPCVATNQVRFVLVDRAGNSKLAGPFAVIVDTVAARAQPVAGLPDGYGSGVQRPEFVWGLQPTVDPNAIRNYQLDLATSLDFTADLIGSSITANRYGSFVFNLTNGATYYWRARAFSVAGATSAYSNAQSIFVDTDAPSGLSFVTVDSLGNSVAEAVQLNLNSGVTAQLTVQDATGGIQRDGPAPVGPSTWTVVLWHLDEGSGGVAGDSGMLGHNAVVMGAPAWVNGRHGKALRLDGSGTQYVHQGNTSSLDPASALTVSAWVSTTFSGWIVNKGDAGGTSYGLRVEADGTASLIVGAATVNCSTVKVADGRWHMVAGTAGGGSGKVYVDGALCASGAATVSPNSANLRVGQRGDGSPPYFGGVVDDVRVLRHAASAAQLAADYSVGNPFTVFVTTSAGQTWQTVTSVAVATTPYISFPGAQFDKSSLSLQIRQLQLAASTNGVVCGGVSPCGATNQIRFVYADRAGNVKSAGPFAVLVDTSMAQPFGTAPPDLSFVSSATPTFAWTESIAVPTHEVQISTDNFATLNASAITLSPSVVSPWTLAHGATYYWRVRGVDAIGLLSPFSPANRFVVDLVPATGSLFGTVTSTGGLAGEAQFNDLAAGVTAQLTVQDLVSGLPAASFGLPADAGTVALWHLDEGTGGAALDASGQNNNGALSGGASWFAGRFKTGLAFAGSQWVQVPYAASLNTPSGMTIEAWINTANTSAAADGQAIVTRWSGAAGFQFTASRTGSGGALSFYPGVGATWLVGSRNVADAQWHHVAATFDGSSARLYVDGAFDGSATLTNGLANTSTPLTIGAAPNDLQAAGFTGTIDEVRLTNFARTAAQIQQAYSAGLSFYAQISTNTGASFNTIIATAPAGSAPYVTLTGAAGSNGAETFQVRNLTLAQSASATTCGGVTPCAGATNQIKLFMTDRAGNLKNFGPFAILVDTQLSQPVAGSPVDGAYVSTTTPLMSWWEKSVMPQHTVELSTSPVFATLTFTTTTALTYQKTPELSQGSTYYWRVKIRNAQGLQSGFSTPNVFYVDAATPTVIAPRVLGSTGGAMAETDFTTLPTGVTTLINVQDQQSGLAVSTSSFSVMYSTNGGASWVDQSTVSVVLSGTGETYVTSLVQFNGRLYAGTIPSARVYSSVDGRNWALGLSGSGESQINALAVFKGKIYAGTYPSAKVLSSADGTSWSTTLSGTGESDVRSLAVFNNRLYAGLSNGKIYATTDGSTWQLMATLPSVNFVDTLAVFNGRLYAGAQPNAMVYSTPDGFTWTNVLSVPGEVRVLALASYNGAIYAGTGLNAKIYGSRDGQNWSQVYQAAGDSNIHTLAAANGKLYAGSSSNGRLHVTPDGSNWAPVSLGTGQNNIQSVAAFGGKLYLGTYSGGRVLEAAPVAATLTGALGSGSLELMTARDLNFVQSLSTATCGGAWGCSATQQIVYSAVDRAGNAGSFGPYAVLVDSSVPKPVIGSLTALTTDSIRVDITPVVDGLSGLKDYQFYLSSSPAFAAPVSTAGFMTSSTHVFTGLQQVTTYYVRVVARDNLLNISPFSISVATATNGVMFFSTADLAVPNVQQGLGTPMMSFTMSTLPGPAAVFNRLTVARVGGTDADVSQAEVWKDANANGVYDGGDIQLGAAAFSLGHAQINLGANAQNVGTSTMTFFVIFRLSPTATIGGVVAAQLDDFAAVGFGNSYRVPGAFPMTTAASTILDGPNDLLITPLSQAPLLAAPGQADVPMMRLRMQTNQGTSVLSKVVLTLLGSAASNEISAVRVYRDNNSNGAFDAGTDGLVTNGNDVFVAGVSTLNFTAQTSSITVSPTLVDYFVTYNVALSANSGSTFGVALDTGTLVTLTGPDTGYLTVVPASSTLTQVVQPNTLTFSPLSTTPGTVFQGDRYAVLKATLTVDQAFAKLGAVTVNRTGSSVDADVAKVSIWLNQAPPALGGFFNPGVDLQLGTGTFSGGKATVNFSPITLSAGATNVIYVVYDLSPLANSGNTIGASLTNSAYLSIVSTATTVVGAFPVGSSTATISATINTLLIPTAQDVTTGGLLQGATHMPMLRLDLRTDRNAVSWSGLTLTRTGTAPDSAVSRVYVYADTNGNFQLDAGTDAIVSSGLDVFSGGVANMTFPGAQGVGVSSQTFFVGVSINPLANPGDTIGIQVATTTAFSLSAPNVVSSQTAAFPISGGPVPVQQYPNTIAVSTSSVAPASAAPGSQNVGLLKLTMNTDISTARWTGLKLDRVGGSDADIASVKVYYDINQLGVWSAGQSAQYLLITSTLSTFGSQGTPGTINLAFSTVAILNTTPQSFFVVADLAPGAAPSDVFAARILNQNYFTVNAPNAVANTSAQSGNVTVATPPSLMVVTAVSSAPASVTQSDTNVPIMRLSVRMQQYSGQWTGLTVLRQGTASDSDVSRVKLYSDNNGNGALDPLLDTLVGTGTFVTGQAALSFNSVQTVATSTRTYFLAYDISSVAGAGGTIGGSIGGPGSFNLLAPNGVLNSGFPVASGLATISPTQSGVFIIAQDKAPAALMQGATAQVMLSLQMNTTQYSVLWNTLQLTRLGASADADVTAIRVFKDVNVNGVIDAGDQELSSGNDRFVASVANVVLGTPQQIDTTPQSYLVAVDIYTFAASTGTLGVRISSAASFGVPAPNFVVNTGFPVSTAMSPIIKRPDTAVFVWTDMVPNGINQGTEIPMARVVANAQREYTDWVQLRLLRQGSLSDGFVNAAKLYLDANNSGTFDSADVQVGSGTVASGVANILFGQVQRLTPSSKTYFVTFVYDVNATVGATVGFTVPDATYAIVRSPDGVSGSGLPFGTATAPILDARTPTMPVVTPDGPFTDSFEQLHVVWGSTVALGSITNVTYAVGTAPGASDTLPWTTLNPIAAAVNIKGLALQTGTTYYVSMRAQSSFGFISPTGVSAPVLVDLTVPGAPNLNATIGQVSVLLNWTPVLAGPSGLMGYLVEYRTGMSPQWKNARTDQPTILGNLGFDEYSSNAIGPKDLTAGDVVTGTSFSMVPKASTVYVRVSAVTGAGKAGTTSQPMRLLFGVLKPGEITDVSSYPNPFDSRKGQATINYTLGAAADVTIKIFSIYGTLIKEMSYPAGGQGGSIGANDVTWDGSDSSGHKTSKGVYLAVIQSGGAKATHKIAVIH